MALQVKNVTKRFGTYTAVNQLDFTIPEGEMFGLLGTNGAGKTTTFRMIIGLLNPTSGEIIWNGKQINQSMSSLIGYLPEERGLYPKLKVSEQLLYFARLRGMSKNEAYKEMEVWLERFKVPRICRNEKFERSYQKEINRKYN